MAATAHSRNDTNRTRVACMCTSLWGL
jgi:hypothetical protein